MDARRKNLTVVTRVTSFGKAVRDGLRNEKVGDKVHTEEMEDSSRRDAKKDS